MNDYIDIKDLTIKFENFTLDNINIKLPKGTILGLVGKNGSGKTTLIKALAGLVKKDNGVVLINGITKYDDEVAYLKELGIMPEDHFLNEFQKPLKVKKFLKLAYKEFDEEFFINNLEMFEIPLNERIRKLSKGMKKKLELITIMSLKPNLLILDEPTANIDPVSKKEILRLLQDYIIDETKTIIYSTHQTDELDKVADYILLLDKGNNVLFDQKETILDNHYIIKVTNEELKDLNKEDIIGIYQTGNNVDVLMKGNNKKIESSIIPTTEDLIYYYSRSGKND